MTTSKAKTASEIRDLRALHPEMRERDFARIHAISEAELVAAYVGLNVTRIEPNLELLLNGLTACGEIMALTRNESAVHEKIGPVEKVVIGPHASMVLGSQIDLRLFPSKWAFGFAVEKPNDDGSIRHSLQFFDAQGMAVFKVHARPATNLEAWAILIANLRASEQGPITTLPKPAAVPLGTPASLDELRSSWSALTDTHQFFGMLKKLNYPRLDAIEAVGEDYAWQLDHAAVAGLFHAAAADQSLPLMAFVGNHGCIQIHSGPIQTVKAMGPWLNIMDDNFHLHLRLDQIAAVWAVRKPTSDGRITSVEVYDQDRELIIQFFGKRSEGAGELGAWRGLVESLPLFSQTNAA